MHRPDVIHRTPTGPARIGTLLALTALALAGCGVFGPDGGSDLNLSGAVRDGGTHLGIGGARIRVSGRAPYTSTAVLATTTTDGSGLYTLRIPPPDNYAGANCTVMEVDVTAAGYIASSGVLDWYIADDCASGGRYTADFDLTRQSAASVATAVVRSGQGSCRMVPSSMMWSRRLPNAWQQLILDPPRFPPPSGSPTGRKPGTGCRAT